MPGAISWMSRDSVVVQDRAYLDLGPVSSDPGHFRREWNLYAMDGARSDPIWKRLVYVSCELTLSKSLLLAQR
ncbi:hypothetical protein RRG08_024853 [Elysia crispata]|uniref:Uncharacterized protein n=1 Tax=Elysia crispata TaxID=231223 RepID=A0AAE0YK74_9GAST|nr:hypothetical protein RRG08_024853 [Elysia crispata]